MMPKRIQNVWGWLLPEKIGKSPVEMDRWLPNQDWPFDSELKDAPLPPYGDRCEHQQWVESIRRREGLPDEPSRA